MYQLWLDIYDRTVLIFETESYENKPNPLQISLYAINMSPHPWLLNMKSRYYWVLPVTPILSFKFDFEQLALKFAMVSFSVDFYLVGEKSGKLILLY